MDYTVELYRIDRRSKQGQRLVSKQDYEGVTLDQVERMHPVRPGWIRQIHETWVLRKNLMGGAEYRERYDTPRSCSPSSELYWSM